jgi:hypothetical protein
MFSGWEYFFQQAANLCRVSGMSEDGTAASGAKRSFQTSAASGEGRDEIEIILGF